jgi:Ser/Thr protein kinase RdoA (MazF antagonist)
VSPEEEPLSGGNVNVVVRVGDTVRRSAGPWTPAVHALLTHLHEVGFHAAPRPLGLDEHGREVLSWVHGRTPYPDTTPLDPPGRLAAVARVVRDFHDAVRGFVPPADARWNVLIPADGDEIIAHHDLAPWNLVVDGEALAFLDWDCAAPGTRLWDVAYALHGFLPLSADPGRQHLDAAARLRLFVDTYGLDEGERLRLVPMLARRSWSMHHFLRDQANRGIEPWTALWREGHGTVWAADATWTAAREESWRSALLG